MKTLSIREIRAALPQLDEMIAEAGEILVTRRGQPLARILPTRSKRRMPSNDELRKSMPRLEVPSEVLIRRDRDGR